MTLAQSSGPASAYGSIGKVQAAYVRMINEQCGINGRKINLIATGYVNSVKRSIVTRSVKNHGRRAS